jgi:hypothetical protein
MFDLHLAHGRPRDGARKIDRFIRVANECANPAVFKQ